MNFERNKKYIARIQLLVAKELKAKGKKTENKEHIVE